jgi:hypothetical protein
VIQKLSIKEDFPMFKSGLYNQSDQEDFGLMQKASFQLMSTAHIGGRANLGYTRLYAKNHLKKRRKCRMLFGKVRNVMQNFQKL